MKSFEMRAPSTVKNAELEMLEAWRAQTAEPDDGGAMPTPSELLRAAASVREAVRLLVATTLTPKFDGATSELSRRHEAH